MVRTGLAVLVGFVALAPGAVLLTAVSVAIGGPEFVVRAGSYRVTPAWMALGLAITAGAGVLGGVVCTLVSRGERRSVVVLAIFVLLFGAGEAVALGSKPDPGVREEGVAPARLVARAVEPGPYRYARPPLAGAAVVMGWGLVRARKGHRIRG